MPSEIAPPSVMALASASPVQRVASTASRLHGASTIEREALEKEIARLMDALVPEDLGIPRPAAKETAAWAAGYGSRDGDAQPLIRTQIIHNSHNFEMCIFFFPRGSRIPLHDHPNMTVFSKVLYGSLAMRSYDWVKPLSEAELDELTAELERQNLAGSAGGDPAASESHAPPRAAVKRADTVITPEAPTFVLRPRFANVHTFEATAETAVLDILTPPYDAEAGRECHYFVEGEGEDADGREAVLVPTGWPQWLRIAAGPHYAGPPVRPTDFDR